ncbi:hypothetical protein SYNTR_1535 [Candidatus Syntrophocurvum alkaliphilum]|uniref:Transporter n=1 Tax=Candidatus Syntrophocurvum alkaliphilum TaxID=2293317 RepID=A0A6I6DBP3_9FIRM|nr:DUF502 domain-containing protein [Candidatus Syntrophocurvum alkaliphilum]QGU00129.1 hypothetical protein SYNTR_1535 [Candidatus Syntrophocurvum alkaliphilum]
MKRITSLFLAGLAALLPIAISLAIFIWLFNFIDNILEPILTYFFGQAIPGIGFLITIVIIILIGFVATSFIGQKLLKFGEKILFKVPLLGKIYGTIKKIIDSVFSSGKDSFRQVALIEFPKEGVYSIGFITNEDFNFGDDNCYSIFIPTTPNPTNGFFILVPKQKVKLLDISVDQGIELVISMGMIKNEVNGS